MPGVSRRFKVIILVLGVLMVVLSGGMGYLTQGLRQTEGLEINDVDLSTVADGAYTGEFIGGRWSNTVEVTVQDHTIVSIEMVKKQRFHLDGPVDEITSRIIEHQSLAVDVVSGATATSKAILKSVELALTLD
jgi:uncharacterized protein with FMN-binding domain